MKIILNGKETAVSDTVTVDELITRMNLNRDAIVVEYNRVILPKEKWTQSKLQPEDELEIISFVGGG